ncbi:MAG: AraC family transcriptional regulator [Clostridiales bacterium]|nr:AraC family transcriptional regulator [Clostridiales bacterium]
MSFIEFEELEMQQDFAMSEPHSHEFYELYFLIDGQREVFVENKMFKIAENTLVVVPPFFMHKTEGGPYKRININVTPDLLTDFQNDFLMKLSKKAAYKINPNNLHLVLNLLEEGARLQANAIKNKTDCILSFTQTILHLLSSQNLTPVSSLSTARSNIAGSTEVLKILSYINQHYNQPITLKDLCDKFFLSKVSLCKKFKNVMHCSIMEYVSRMRLSKAKSLLKDTNKSIEDVALDCGFSSANYLGLIFKKEVGLSPLNYRKSR